MAFLVHEIANELHYYKVGITEILLDITHMDIAYR